jgi:hypothetical protein
MTKPKHPKVHTDSLPDEQSTRVSDLRGLIQDTRAAVAATVNAEMTKLYWRIGKRIQIELLGNDRAAYGKAIVSTVSRQLREDYGNGFSTQNIRHMIRFAETFPDEERVSPLWLNLSWSHFKEIIYLKDPLQIEFYAELCRVEHWSVRALRKKIDSMLFERTALSK